MSSAASRYVAALLSKNPGSQVVEQDAAATVVSVPMGGVRGSVVVVELLGPASAYAEGVQRLVAGAKMGHPLHLVLVHPGHPEVEGLLKDSIKPTGLQMKQLGGWSWVPGQPIVSVRGPAWAALKQAAEFANAHPDLSLENVSEAVDREAALVDQFQQAVMQRTPVVSYAITAVCVAFFGLQYFWGSGLPVLAASRMGAEIPSRVLAGDWWRLFSVMLLHANFLHLVMNMMAMLSFGPFLERLIGSSRYLVLYVLSGLGGALLSLARGGDGIGVGASGGIWGLMVAGAVVVTWPRGLLPGSLAHQLRQRAWTPVGINLLYSLQPGIDMLAHVGGGLAGGLAVLLLTRGGAPDRPLQRSKLFDLGALVMALLLAGSMGIALQQGKPWELVGSWKLTETKVGDTGLSLKVPEGWAASHEPEKQRFHWGELEGTGAELIVLVTEPTAVPEDERDTAFGDMLAELKTAPAGLHFAQAPQRITLPSGRPAVFTELVPDDKDDVRFLWQWWLLDEDGRWVMVLANALNTTSDERKLQLREVADSLR